eukprot:g7762.t1
MSTTQQATAPAPPPTDGDAPEQTAGERDQAESDLLVPESVKSFMKDLYNALLIEDNDDMLKNYEVEFPRLTATYYPQVPWPSPQAISSVVEDDPTFLALYEDLRVRHMFAKLQPTMPTLQQRLDAWGNYCTLFEGLLGDKSKEIDLRQLPAQWVFDLLHEFVYQYQAMSQFRCKWAAVPEEEQALLRANTEAWSTVGVLRYLNRFVEVSRIRQILAGEEGAKADTPLLRSMGYFSMVMLSRVHALLGDYHNTLKALDSIISAEGDGTSDDKPTGEYVRVPICYVTLYFHMGFAQVMARRYAAARASFQSALLFIFRNRHLFNRSAPGDQMSKWSDKMLALLAIVTALAPGGRLEEQVGAKLHEKYGDKLRRMQMGEEGAFEDTFSYACPKFILAAAPTMEGVPAANAALEAHQAQLAVFLEDVRQQLDLPTIRSYLKLYTSIGMDKLARFREVNDGTLQAQLLSLKHKALHSDTHFFVAGEMAHVEERRDEQLFGKFFVQHVQKLHEIVGDVRSIAAASDA